MARSSDHSAFGRRPKAERIVRPLLAFAVIAALACSSSDNRLSPATGQGGGSVSTGPSTSMTTTGTGTSSGSGGGGIIGVPEAAPPDDVGVRVSDSSGILNDASIESGPGVCVPDGGRLGPGPFARKCAAPTDNECDGHSDINPQLKNGAYGNGFDDDCDGKVDEGCSCDPGHPVGTTKVCSLVSATQVDPATNQPVGWCAINSVGTETCMAIGHEVQTTVWDGECRGAQPPFADDVCAHGDFDCDGRDLNSKAQDCACHVDVKCPTDPIVTAPFPDPNNLSPIDGSSWVNGGATNATNWKWTVTGGDCDNILPHPTFAVYPTARATFGGMRLSSDTPQTGLGTNANQHGFVMGPGANIGPVIYPAFALSGDYLVKGEWDSSDGHHSCTVKVQVRSPGIRVELCWAPMPQDVDLHFARLQNPKSCTHGWFFTCARDESGDDCYYSTSTGCRGFFGVPPATPFWGYPVSPTKSCHGWGSKRVWDCDNPRLDVDNITCDPKVADPMNNGITGGLDAGFGNYFCTPENVNLDNPNNGDRFMVGVDFYSAGTLGAARIDPPRPHVNVYCNGERKLAFGFDPTSTPPNNFPLLQTAGADATGDMWEVATVEAKVSAGMLTDCTITPVHSRAPKAAKDGTNAVCVDTNPQNGANLSGSTNWKFNAAGTYPTTADAFCWH